MKLHDFNNCDVQERIAETFDWCISRAFHSLPDIGKIREYLRRFDEATAMMREAYAERDRLKNKLLNRDYQKSEKYLRGVALLQDTDPRSSITLAAQLRSPALAPPRSLGEMQTEEERESVVHSIVKRRKELLHSGGDYRSSLQGHAGGRLLLYWPEENVSDGASEHATRGFFDVNDVPPWDTWVAYSRSTLLSWVPPQLVDLVQKGIDVNVVDCIRWLD